MYFVYGINKNEKDIVDGVSLLSHNIKTIEEVEEHQDFFKRLFKGFFNSEVKITNNYKDIMAVQNKTLYFISKSNEVKEDFKQCIEVKYNKEKTCNESLNGECYKTNKIYSFPKNIYIPIEYVDDSKTINEMLSDAYFEGKPIGVINYKDSGIAITSYCVVKDENNKPIGRIYKYTEYVYLVKLDDLIKTKMDEKIINRHKATESLLNSVLKSNLEAVLEKHHINVVYNYNTKVKRYVFDINAIDILLFEYYKNFVLPDLESIGIKINKKNNTTFTHSSLREKTLFTNKHIKITL